MFRRLLCCAVLVAVAFGLFTFPLGALARPTARDRVQVMRVQVRAKVVSMRVTKEMSALPVVPAAVAAAPPVRPVVAPKPIRAADAAPMTLTAVQQAIADAFPGEERVALCVARYESGFDPAARTGSMAGLFQIATRVHAARINRMGFTVGQMYEAGPNIAVARALRLEQGWRGPWAAQRGKCF